jgi:hypothetical protein
LRIDIAVKLLVIDAMRNTVSASTSAFEATSRTPVAAAWASSPFTITPHAAPGTCCSWAYWVKRRSTSTNADSSFARSACAAARGSHASATTATSPAASICLMRSP